MWAIVTWFFYFVFYSFIGWACETIFCSLAQKRFVNRGFLSGPFCPLYGFGAIFVLLLFSGYADDPLALFLQSIVVTSVLEYITSVLLERVFHMRLWDYSHKKWNINGRVCLRNSLMFGVLSVLLVCVIHPFFSSLLEKLPEWASVTLFGVLVAYFICDLAVTIQALNSIQRTVSRQHVDLDTLSALREQYLASLRERRGEAFSRFKMRMQLRLMDAFPTMDAPQHSDSFAAFKDALREHIESRRKAKKKKDG